MRGPHLVLLVVWSLEVVAQLSVDVVPEAVGLGMSASTGHSHNRDSTHMRLTSGASLVR